MLTDSGVTILKVLPAIDKDEQRQAIPDRVERSHQALEDRTSDIAERRFVGRLSGCVRGMMLTETSTRLTPLGILVPANRNWLRDLAIARS